MLVLFCCGCTSLRNEPKDNLNGLWHLMTIVGPSDGYVPALLAGSFETMEILPDIFDALENKLRTE